MARVSGVTGGLAGGSRRVHGHARAENRGGMPEKLFLYRRLVFLKIEGDMSGMNRRHLLLAGVGVLVLGARAMPVSEMTAGDAFLVDIRTPGEWTDTGVIEGAHLVEFDFQRPGTFLPQIAEDIADGRQLVLICNSGNRTQVAAEFLAKQIPNPIVSIEGGMQKVLASGYRTVRPG